MCTAQAAFPRCSVSCAVAACSTGVFAGGVAWSCLYVRYGSVWPGYLSHAIVDVAVFGTGAALLFG